MEQQNKIEPRKKYPPKIDIIFQAILLKECYTIGQEYMQNN